MLRFNELRIDTEKKALIIEALVEDCAWYEDCYIGSVEVWDQRKYQAQSSKPLRPIWKLESLTDAYVCTSLEEEKLKKIRVVLPFKLFTTLGISIDKTMFFVRVTGEGYPQPECPCGQDNGIIEGVAINLYPFYQEALKYLGELRATCQIPMNLTDMILKFKALQLTLKTGNFLKAAEYWEQLFDYSVIQKTINKCHCHG